MSVRTAAVALLFALALPAAAAEPPAARPRSFSARADPSAVRLGEPFVYEITIVDDAAVRYVLPRDPGLGTLELRSARVERERAGDEATTTARLEVAIFDALGETTLPAVRFDAIGPDGVARLEVPGVPIVVEATAEGDELEDLRGPQSVRVFHWLPIAIGGGALVAAGLAWLGWRALRRRPAPAAPAAPARTPEERALDALAALEAGGCADARVFYFALSEIVRGFLEEETTLAAREMTTSELVDALVAREVPGLSLAQLGAWLERGDLHRFAGVPATAEAARADLERAREIVRSVAAAKRAPREAA